MLVRGEKRITRMNEHVEGRNHGNSRNRSTPRTAMIEIGMVTVDVPRDRDGVVRTADRQDASAPAGG